MTLKFHNDLDAFEARVRAEQEETDIHEADKPTIKGFSDEELSKCTCNRFLRFYPYVDYDPNCPIHKKHYQLQQDDKKPQCCCYEYVGDNSGCPVHGTHADEDEEGSDTSMASQLNDAGFGSGGAM
jgi:hypothetical protein